MNLVLPPSTAGGTASAQEVSAAHFRCLISTGMTDTVMLRFLGRGVGAMEV